MICKKCGAAMPNNAKFCGECGWTVTKDSVSPVALATARKQAKTYRISTIVLAVFCVLLAIGWALSGTNDPYKNLSNYEEEVQVIDRAGVELSGIYVVGEDSELPAGRYNIYPPEGKSYFSVGIFDNMDSAKKRYDKDYNSLAVEDLYSLTRGYKLKEGQIISICDGSAFFELVEETAEAEEAAEGAEEAADGTAGETADDQGGN